VSKRGTLAKNAARAARKISDVTHGSAERSGCK